MIKADLLSKKSVSSIAKRKSGPPLMVAGALALVACADVIGANFDDAHLARAGAPGVGGRLATAGSDEPNASKSARESLGGAAGSFETPFGSRAASAGVEDGGVLDAGAASVSEGPSLAGAGSVIDPVGGSALAAAGNAGAGSGAGGGGTDTGGNGSGGGASGGTGGNGAGGQGDGGSGGIRDGGGRALRWNSTELSSLGRAIAPQVLAQSIGAVMNADQQPECVGVLVAADLGIFMGCRVNDGDIVHFPAAIEENGSLGAHDLAVLGGEPHDEMSFTWLDSHAEVLFAPIKRRLPVPGEPARLIRMTASGSLAFAELDLDPKLFDQNPPGVWDPLQTTAVFGSDGQLLGFCAFGADQNLHECTSLIALRKSWWLLPLLQSLGSTAYWRDLDGDARADAIMLNRFQLEARLSSPIGLGASILSPPDTNCYGWNLSVVGDVTGDHRADVVGVDSSVRTFVSSNAQFTVGDMVALNTDFSASDSAILADVDADGRSELALMQPSGELDIVFSLASGSPRIETWISKAPRGYLSFELADVTGDQRADAIFGFNDHVEVMVSDGSHFATAETWLTGMHVVPPGWFFADVTGDGRADAVRLDLVDSQVFPSNGSGFVPAQSPWRSIPLGERGNAFADVDGDGKADMIAQDYRGIRVARSTGTDFSNLVHWTYDSIMSGH